MVELTIVPITIEYKLTKGSKMFSVYEVLNKVKSQMVDHYRNK